MIFRLIKDYIFKDIRRKRLDWLATVTIPQCTTRMRWYPNTNHYVTRLIPYLTHSEHHQLLIKYGWLKLDGDEGSFVGDLLQLDSLLVEDIKSGKLKFDDSLRSHKCGLWGEDD